MEVYKWYKVSRFLYLHHVPALPGIIKASIRILWGGVIPYQADIGEGTVIGYQGIGVVIHKRCVLGKNCHISQNVTVGAGANIIGPVHVGNNVEIGAGAVVIRDIPDDCIAVGVPAKVIKKSESEQ